MPVNIHARKYGTNLWLRHRHFRARHIWTGQCTSDQRHSGERGDCCWAGEMRPG